MPPPTVSVIVPSYNRLPFLRQTVDSVLAQTLGDLELIVVDDGSSDGTAAYVSALVDPRLRRIALEHTGSVAHVRNSGAREAAGRFLAFLDSDDLWHPNKLRIQVVRTREAGVRWSYGRYDHIDASGVPVPAASGPWRGCSGNVASAVLLQTAEVALCTVLVERALFEELGGFDEDPRLLYREDYEFLVRLAAAAPTLAISEESLAQVRVHPGRGTRSLTGATAHLATATAYTRAMERLSDPDLRCAARGQRTRHLAEAATAHLRAGAPLRAAWCLWRCLLAGGGPRRLGGAVLRAFGWRGQRV